MGIFVRQPARRLLTAASGASAVEFALVAPILLLLLCGIVGYGYVLGVYHGVQQIASEAARASIPGLTDAERETLARAFVAQNAPAYAFLEPARLRVMTAFSGPPAAAFQVAVVYDMSGSVLHRLGSLVALPAPLVERRAVIQRGGY